MRHKTAGFAANGHKQGVPKKVGKIFAGADLPSTHLPWAQCMFLFAWPCSVALAVCAGGKRGFSRPKKRGFSPQNGKTGFGAKTGFCAVFFCAHLRAAFWELFFMPALRSKNGNSRHGQGATGLPVARPRTAAGRWPHTTERHHQTAPPSRCCVSDEFSYVVAVRHECHDATTRGQTGTERA